MLRLLAAPKIKIYVRAQLSDNETKIMRTKIAHWKKNFHTQKSSSELKTNYNIVSEGNKHLIKY